MKNILPIKCIAIDDEPLALQLLRAYIAKTPSLQLQQSFEDAIAAAEYSREHEPELIFIDIQMPEVSGLDLIRSLNYKPVVIFTTAHRKFAVQGFELEAMDYLLKPFSFDRFTKAVKRAVEFIAYKNNPSQNEEFLYVHSEYKLVKIDVSEIEYIESLEDYIKIHLSGAKPLLTLMPLKKVLEKLPAGKFERVHRSYIISTSKIKNIGNKKLTLGTAEIPVGETYLEVLKKLKKS